MTTNNTAGTYRLRTLMWAALCQCMFERRPVSLLPRPYNGRPATPTK